MKENNKFEVQLEKLSEATSLLMEIYYKQYQKQEHKKNILL